MKMVLDRRREFWRDEPVKMDSTAAFAAAVQAEAARAGEARPEEAKEDTHPNLLTRITFDASEMLELRIEFGQEDDAQELNQDANNNNIGTQNSNQCNNNLNLNMNLALDLIKRLDDARHTARDARQTETPDGRPSSACKTQSNLNKFKGLGAALRVISEQFAQMRA